MNNYLHTLATLALFLASSYALADYELDKNFNAAYFGTLALDTDLGSVDIRTHDREEIEVKVTVTGSGADDFSVVFTDHENGLDIRGERTFGDGSFWNWKNQLRVTFKLTLPSRYDVDVKTAGGSIKVAGLTGGTRVNTSGGSLDLSEINGRLEGRTSGGPIDIMNIAGPVWIRTSGGPISVENVAGDIEADTSGGAISLQNIKGNTHAHTSGGSIDIENASAAYEMEVNTGGGSINARFIGKVQQDIRLSSSGGSVNAHFEEGSAIDVEARGSSVRNALGEFQGKQSKRKLEGKINGGGPKVSLSTSGGGVWINTL